MRVTVHVTSMKYGFPNLLKKYNTKGTMKIASLTLKSVEETQSRLDYIHLYTKRVTKHNH